MAGGLGRVYHPLSRDQPHEGHLSQLRGNRFWVCLRVCSLVSAYIVLAVGRAHTLHCAMYLLPSPAGLGRRDQRHRMCCLHVCNA